MNPYNFKYINLPQTIYFGGGKINILPELLQGFNRPFVVAGHFLKKYVTALIAQVTPKEIVCFDEVIQHVPIHLVNKAIQQFQDVNADVLVAIGGGSSTGLAKAMAKELHVPIIAVPSTYAGSEMTNIWGVTSENGKITGRDVNVLPKIVVYDPNLSVTMPFGLAAASAMNAMAHLMEAIYADDSNPITYHNSLLGVATLLKGMQQLAESQKLTLATNELLLFGASLAGKALAEVAMALHHKSAHVLGGSFGMEHAKVHTVMQTYVLAYQWQHLSDRIKTDFQKVFQHENPAWRLREVSKSMNNPTSLKEIGFKKRDIPLAVEKMLQNPYPNPAPLTKEGLTKLLENAYTGNL